MLCRSPETVELRDSERPDKHFCLLSGNSSDAFIRYPMSIDLVQQVPTKVHDGMITHDDPKAAFLPQLGQAGIS